MILDFRTCLLVNTFKPNMTCMQNGTYQGQHHPARQSMRHELQVVTTAPVSVKPRLYQLVYQRPAPDLSTVSQL